VAVAAAMIDRVEAANARRHEFLFGLPKVSSKA
jgi:hypothetical protein